MRLLTLYEETWESMVHLSAFPQWPYWRGFSVFLTLCESLTSLYDLVVDFPSQDVMLTQTWVCIDLKKNKEIGICCNLNLWTSINFHLIQWLHKKLFYKILIFNNRSNLLTIDRSWCCLIMLFNCSLFVLFSELRCKSLGYWDLVLFVWILYNI